jgi:hypothetical protein
LSEIVLLVEGATEDAFVSALKEFLDPRCVAAGRPRVRLRPVVTEHLRERDLKLRVWGNLKRSDVLGVIALMDVKCAGRPRQFADAAETIAYLRSVAPDEPRYRPHAAQFDFEAWLLPYWGDICRRVGRKQAPPGPKPEQVDLEHPPSRRLYDLYRQAGLRYSKPRDAAAILRGKDLTLSAAHCPQLAALLGSLLDLAGCPPLA